MRLRAISLGHLYGIVGLMYGQNGQEWKVGSRRRMEEGGESFELKEHTLELRKRRVRRREL